MIGSGFGIVAQNRVVPMPTEGTPLVGGTAAPGLERQPSLSESIQDALEVVFPPAVTHEVSIAISDVRSISAVEPFLVWIV